MKRYLVIAVIVFLIVPTIFAQKKQVQIAGENNYLSISPSKPMVGDEVTVTFNPKGTVLKNSGNIIMAACFIKAMDRGYFDFSSQPLTMKKEGQVWKVKLKISDSTSIVRIKFVGKQGEVNNEANGGYYLHIYNENGLEDPNSAIAYIKMVENPSFGELTESENQKRLVFANKMKPNQQLKKIFDIYPELKRKYFSSAYGLIIVRLRDINYAAKELKTLSNFTNLTEGEYIVMKMIYQVWKDSLNLGEKLQVLLKEGLNKFPNGGLAKTLYNDSLWQDIDLNKKVEILNNAKKHLSDNDIFHLAWTVFNQMISEKKYDLALDFFSTTVLPICTTDLLKENLYFIENYVEPLIEAKIGLAQAIKITGDGVAIARSELNDPKEEKLDVFLQDELYNIKESTLCGMLIEYGNALCANGDDEKAAASYAEVFKIRPISKMERRNIDALENYVILINKLKQYNIAKQLIEEAIKYGKDTYKMWDILKMCYIKEHGVDDGYSKYFAQLEDAPNSRKNNLKKELIKESMPDFALRDMDGKVERLSSLKGSIVVLDFWGTWCGNCIASFPGMQEVVNRFAGKKDIKILFIDNERVANKKESERRANNFLKTMGYNFINLMDYDGSTATAFKVLGYPTKLIIDREGNVRFKMIGFYGSTKDLVTELSTTIRILE